VAFPVSFGHVSVAEFALQMRHRLNELSAIALPQLKYKDKLM
jgi:hypothetical protein